MNEFQPQAKDPPPVPSVDRGLEEILLAEARTEVSYADNKASFVLAATSIGFSALLAGVLANNWRPTQLSSVFELLWWLGAILALLSLSAAVSAVWPRTGSPSLDRPIYYWGQISKLAKKEDLARMLTSNPPVRMDRTRDQLWHLSQLVALKYYWIRVAIVIGGLAALAFAIVGLGEL